ncbi:unnamed protein product [Symbiodinium natans]|uniref:Uncharacterized protein n=1 Tax=Symbiodinium natans TaxID=878477 RepID=A0A812UAR7_9DINO|nr:unnamed protein product [Symbiodinium natans]
MLAVECCRAICWPCAVCRHHCHRAPTAEKRRPSPGTLECETMRGSELCSERASVLSSDPYSSLSIVALVQRDDVGGLAESLVSASAAQVDSSSFCSVARQVLA